MKSHFYTLYSACRHQYIIPELRPVLNSLFGCNRNDDGLRGKCGGLVDMCMSLTLRLRCHCYALHVSPPHANVYVCKCWCIFTNIKYVFFYSWKKPPTTALKWVWVESFPETNAPQYFNICFLHALLDVCRLWQWYIYLLECVLDLVRRCEAVFSQTWKKILSSSTLVVFCGLRGLSVLLSWPVHSFFWGMNQNVKLATPKAFAIMLLFSA